MTHRNRAKYRLFMLLAALATLGLPGLAHATAIAVNTTAEGRVLKIRKGTTPEPIHREIYATLRISAEVVKPVRTWDKPSP